MSTRKRPIQWMEDASPEEIGEALISVGIEKTTRVVAYLAQRIGPELAEVFDLAVEKAQEDPAGALARAGLGAINSFLRR